MNGCLKSFVPWFIMMGVFLGFKVEPKLRFSDEFRPSLFVLWLFNLFSSLTTTCLKTYVEMAGLEWNFGLLLPLSFLFLITFPRNMAQVIRRYTSTSVRKIFFDSFCDFWVMTHFLAEKVFQPCIQSLNITSEIWMF